MKRHGNHCHGLRVSLAVMLSLSPVVAETTEELEKTFAASSGGRLIVDVDFGVLNVTGTADDQVDIKVVRKVSRTNKEAEERFLSDRPVEFSQEGDAITVRSKGKNITTWTWTGKQTVSAQYTITVPSRFSVRLKTSGGGIEARNLTGQVNANTSGGPLSFTGVRGPLEGKTSGGNIQIADCEGQLQVDTSGGGIESKGGGGSLQGRTSGGSISVKSFEGSVRASTSGGGVRIEDVVGAVFGSTSGGSVSASLPTLAESVRLETSGGSVTLRVPAEARFDLDAATSGGSARCELPVEITGKKSGSHVKGPVNGGGKPVVLRSSGGNVSVKKI